MMEGLVPAVIIMVCICVSGLIMTQVIASQHLPALTSLFPGDPGNTLRSDSFLKHLKTTLFCPLGV